MSARQSISTKGLAPRTRVGVLHVKKQRKQAKKLIRLLRKMFGVAALAHECPRKGREVGDALRTKIARVDLVMALFVDDAAQAAGLHRAAKHAETCGVPVVAIATGALPGEVAARCRVVLVDGSLSDIERRLETLDLAAILTHDRRAKEPSVLGQQADAAPSTPLEPAEYAPTARVAAIVHRSHLGDDGILLMRRPGGPFEGRWSLPEGEIGRFESLQDAAVRAVKEETGLDFEASLLTCVDEIVPNHDQHSVLIGFVGAGIGEEGVKQSAQVETDWRPVIEALSGSLVPSHRELLQAFADGV